MRIGLFCDMYTPHVSGVTNHIRLYKRYFEQQGHEVFVFTFGNNEHADDEPHVIRTRGFEWGETGWNASPLFGSKAKKLIPSLDIAHVHHPFQSGQLLIPFANKYDIPLVFTNHTRYDLYSDAYASFVPPTIRYGYLRMALSRFLCQCALVITPSQSISQWLAGFVQYWYATVIPNGIDVDAFAKPSVSLCRADLGLDDEALVFCYVGRIASEKNALYLLEEFASVATRLPHAQLLMVGGGTDYEKARQYIHDNGLEGRVVCAGVQPYHLLPAYEHLANVFVTGSISEVHPLAVMEALATGLPIVAIDSPGIRETVLHDTNGLLAARIAPGALADNMMLLANDSTLRAKLVEGAQETISHYTLTKTAGRVLAEYERMLA